MERYPDKFLQKKLDERKKNGSFRQLRVTSGKTDLCSNDYLGIVAGEKLNDIDATLSHGATGSRLLSGNYPLIETVEKEIAEFHQAEAGLMFNSGYDANVGLLSSVPQKGDTVIYDQLVHASIRDGIRLSFAHSFAFAHNDLVDLEKKLSAAAGNIFIVSESVFSMDGDLCPLAELVSIAGRWGANLIIDEAHATGVIGKQGEGLVQQLHLQNKVFARVHTFGKAAGCHGAIVLGSQDLRNYLVNFARSFVFSTALPAQSVAAIRRSYQLFPGMKTEREHLQKLITRFQSAHLPLERLPSQTPIQILVIPGNEKVKKVAAMLQDHQLDVRPILYPTVPKDKERLRIVLHAFNTEEEIEKLVNVLQVAG